MGGIHCFSSFILFSMQSEQRERIYCLQSNSRCSLHSCSLRSDLIKKVESEIHIKSYRVGDSLEWFAGGFFVSSFDQTGVCQQQTLTLHDR